MSVVHNDGARIAIFNTSKKIDIIQASLRGQGLEFDLDTVIDIGGERFSIVLRGLSARELLLNVIEDGELTPSFIKEQPVLKTFTNFEDVKVTVLRKKMTWDEIEKTIGHEIILEEE